MMTIALCVHCLWGLILSKSSKLQRFYLLQSYPWNDNKVEISPGVWAGVTCWCRFSLGAFGLQCLRFPGMFKFYYVWCLLQELWILLPLPLYNHMHSFTAFISTCLPARSCPCELPLLLCSWQQQSLWNTAGEVFVLWVCSCVQLKYNICVSLFNYEVRMIYRGWVYS